MTKTQKEELIIQITDLLNMLLEVEQTEAIFQPVAVSDKPLEMLTIKECAQLVDGLSEHTVRQLVTQGKVTSIRTGAGRNGKILISKVSLLKYLGIA